MASNRSVLLLVVAVAVFIPRWSSSSPVVKRDIGEGQLDWNVKTEAVRFWQENNCYYPPPSLYSLSSYGSAYDKLKVCNVPFSPMSILADVCNAFFQASRPLCHETIKDAEMRLRETEQSSVSDLCDNIRSLMSMDSMRGLFHYTTINVLSDPYSQNCEKLCGLGQPLHDVCAALAFTVSVHPDDKLGDGTDSKTITNEASNEEQAAEENYMAVGSNDEFNGPLGGEQPQLYPGQGYPQQPLPGALGEIPNDGGQYGQPIMNDQQSEMNPGGQQSDSDHQSDQQSDQQSDLGLGDQPDTEYQHTVTGPGGEQPVIGIDGQTQPDLGLVAQTQPELGLGGETQPGLGGQPQPDFGLGGEIQPGLGPDLGLGDQPQSGEEQQLPIGGLAEQQPDTGLLGQQPDIGFGDQPETAYQQPLEGVEEQQPQETAYQQQTDIYGNQQGYPQQAGGLDDQQPLEGLDQQQPILGEGESQEIGYPQETGVLGEQQPDQGYPQPAAGLDEQQPGYQQPLGGLDDQQPMLGQSEETGIEEQPNIFGDQQQPDAGYQQPDAGYQQPDAGYQQPDTGYQQEDTGYQQPDTGLGDQQQQETGLQEQLGTGYQQPDTGYQQPDTGYQQPDTGYQQPDTGYQQPDTGYQQPDTGYQQPNTGYQQPDMGNQIPDAGYQQPDSGYPQQPDSGYPQQPDTGYPQQPGMGYPQPGLGNGLNTNQESNLDSGESEGDSYDVQDEDQMIKNPNLVQNDMFNQVQDTPFQTFIEEKPTNHHFLAYSLTAIILVMGAYVIYHNKQKIVAIIIEGRNRGNDRRKGTGTGSEYQKLTQETVDA